MLRALRHVAIAAGILGLALTPQPARATLPGGSFSAVTLTDADTVTVNSASAGRWFGHSYALSNGVAEISQSTSSQTRALALVVPMPVNGAYSLTVRVSRSNHLTQSTYWHVLAVNAGTALSLTHNGIPTSITQSGVKSLALTQITDASASNTWRTVTSNFTISSADANAYPFLVFAFIGSRGSAEVLRFDDVNADIPYASTATTGLDCAWVTRTSAIHQLSNLTWTAPALTTKEHQINWMNTNRPWHPQIQADRFGVRLTGNITIPTTGSWTFQLASDDGSILIINGVTVINHDGQHSFSNKSTTVTLAAGSYPIEVRFFENGGAAGLMLHWRGPSDTALAPIPASAFTGGSSTRPRVVRWREEASVQ